MKAFNDALRKGYDSLRIFTQLMVGIYILGFKHELFVFIFTIYVTHFKANNKIIFYTNILLLSLLKT